MTSDFYDWLHFNDGDRYEGLHEEFLEGGGEAGGFLEWAEAKFAATLSSHASQELAKSLRGSGVVPGPTRTSI